MPVCKSCETAIVFVKSERGKAMCIEMKPSADGNVVIDVKSDGSCVARVVKPEEFARFPVRYLSHFARCPNAASHRSKRK